MHTFLFLFLIYGISIEICYFLQLYTYKFRKFPQYQYSYICYLYNAIRISRIHIIVFDKRSFIHTYLARNNYSEKTEFEYI